MTSKFIVGSALLALGAPAVAQAQAPANITRAQVVSELNAAFGRVDTNKDGFISVAEADAAQQRVAAETAAKIAKDVEAQFAKLDTDHNGQLSVAEFKAGAPKPHMLPGADILKRLDANKDGKISSSEFQAERLGQFDRLDTNHDGAISVTEQQAARVH